MVEYVVLKGEQLLPYSPPRLAAFNTIPRELRTPELAHTLVSPLVLPKNKITQLYTYVVDHREAFYKEINANKRPAHVGDFLSGAHHMVVFPKSAQKGNPIASMSSWATTWDFGKGEELARFCYNIFVAQKSKEQTNRGKGIGRNLIEALIKYAKDKGEKYIVLSASDLSKGFFEKFGFKVVESYSIHGGSAHLMSKTLAFALPLLAMGVAFFKPSTKEVI